MADLDVTIPDALLPCPCCQEPMHLGAGYDGDPMWEHPVRAGEDAMCPLGVVTMYAWDEPSIALWNRRSPPPDKDRIAASSERGETL